MAKTAKQAYNEIKTYIYNYSRLYAFWYVGITSNPKNHLFNDHRVSERFDKWICVECINFESARNAEDALLRLGCDGGGGGDETSSYVYAYFKTPSSKP
jgi:hypothetical protein